MFWFHGSKTSLMRTPPHVFVYTPNPIPDTELYYHYTTFIGNFPINVVKQDHSSPPLKMVGFSGKASIIKHIEAAAG